MKTNRKLYCFSHQEFDNFMEKMGWENRPDNGNSTISIASKNDEEYGHWFNVELNNNINLDFDDISPEHWWQSWVDKKDYYDLAFDNYINNISDDIFFTFKTDMFNTQIDLHAMNYEEAFKLVQFIDERIKAGDNIYVHCSAGASRSQGVVRYILDTYYDINWETRKDNQCLTPNWHVVRMLKRVYRYLYYV